MDGIRKIENLRNVFFAIFILNFLICFDNSLFAFSSGSNYAESSQGMQLPPLGPPYQQVQSQQQGSFGISQAPGYLAVSSQDFSYSMLPMQMPELFVWDLVQIPDVSPFAGYILMDSEGKPFIWQGMEEEVIAYDRIAQIGYPDPTKIYRINIPKGFGIRDILSTYDINQDSPFILSLLDYYHKWFREGYILKDDVKMRVFGGVIQYVFPFKKVGTNEEKNMFLYFFINDNGDGFNSSCIYGSTDNIREGLSSVSAELITGIGKRAFVTWKDFSGSEDNNYSISVNLENLAEPDKNTGFNINVSREGGVLNVQLLDRSNNPLGLYTVEGLGNYLEDGFFVTYALQQPSQLMLDTQFYKKLGEGMLSIVAPTSINPLYFGQDVTIFEYSVSNASIIASLHIEIPQTVRKEYMCGINLEHLMSYLGTYGGNLRFLAGGGKYYDITLSSEKAIITTTTETEDKVQVYEVDREQLMQVVSECVINSQLSDLEGKIESRSKELLTERETRGSTVFQTTYSGNDRIHIEMTKDEIGIDPATGRTKYHYLQKYYIVDILTGRKKVSGWLEFDYFELQGNEGTGISRVIDLTKINAIEIHWDENGATAKRIVKLLPLATELAYAFQTLKIYDVCLFQEVEGSFKLGIDPDNLDALQQVKLPQGGTYKLGLMRVGTNGEGMALERLLTLRRSSDPRYDYELEEPLYYDIPILQELSAYMGINIENLVQPDDGSITIDVNPLYREVFEAIGIGAGEEGTLLAQFKELWKNYLEVLKVDLERKGYDYTVEPGDYLEIIRIHPSEPRTASTKLKVTIGDDGGTFVSIEEYSGADEFLGIKKLQFDGDVRDNLQIMLGVYYVLQKATHGAYRPHIEPFLQSEKGYDSFERLRYERTYTPFDFKLNTMYIYPLGTEKPYVYTKAGSFYTGGIISEEDRGLFYKFKSYFLLPLSDGIGYKSWDEYKKALIETGSFSVEDLDEVSGFVVYNSSYSLRTPLFKYEKPSENRRRVTIFNSLADVELQIDFTLGGEHYIYVIERDPSDGRRIRIGEFRIDTTKSNFKFEDNPQSIVNFLKNDIPVICTSVAKDGMYVGNEAGIKVEISENSSLEDPLTTQVIESMKEILLYAQIIQFRSKMEELQGNNPELFAGLDSTFLQVWDGVMAGVLDFVGAVNEYIADIVTNIASTTYASSPYSPDEGTLFSIDCTKFYRVHSTVTFDPQTGEMWLDFAQPYFEEFYKDKTTFDSDRLGIPRIFRGSSPKPALLSPSDYLIKVGTNDTEALRASFDRFCSWVDMIIGDFVEEIDKESRGNLYNLLFELYKRNDMGRIHFYLLLRGREALKNWEDPDGDGKLERELPENEKSILNIYYDEVERLNPRYPEVLKRLTFPQPGDNWAPRDGQLTIERKYFDFTWRHALMAAGIAAIPFTPYITTALAEILPAEVLILPTITVPKEVVIGAVASFLGAVNVAISFVPFTYMMAGAQGDFIDFFNSLDDSFITNLFYSWLFGLLFSPSQLGVRFDLQPSNLVSLPFRKLLNIFDVPGKWYTLLSNPRQYGVLALRAINNLLSLGDRYVRTLLNLGERINASLRGAVPFLRNVPLPNLGYWFNIYSMESLIEEELSPGGMRYSLKTQALGNLIPSSVLNLGSKTLRVLSRYALRCAETWGGFAEMVNPIENPLIGLWLMPGFFNNARQYSARELFLLQRTR
ncbi:MAG: hypothetical protein AB7E08_00005 [Candidatus Omnitrophota bacterium]